MTRFLLSLDQAVDTVFAVLKDGNAGDTFVPRAPSATVENIAKALIGTRDIEIKVTGIRPGEKVHEIMISEEEIHHCQEVGDYFAIHSMLPELNEGLEKTDILKSEYSSGDEILDLDGTIKLLEQHDLMNINEMDENNQFNEMLR